MRWASAIIRPMVSSATGFEHVGRVCDADIAGPGGLGVDIVVADEAGDDFEIGQRIHQIGLHARAGMGADAGAVGGEPRLGVGLFVQLVDRTALGQGRFTDRQQLASSKNLDGHWQCLGEGRVSEPDIRCSVR
jgi:hypothetical protein